MRISASFLLVGSLMLPSAAYSEEESGSNAQAAKLFEEGRDLVARGRVEEGCAKLAESEALEPAIGTLYNLADCNERLGKTATAHRLFGEVAERTKAAAQPEREQKALGRMKALSPKLMKIRLSIPAGGKVNVVKLDGVVVSPKDYNVALPTDPGDHVVVAETPSDDGEPFSEDVDLSTEGKTVTIAIPVGAGAKMKPRVGMIIGGGITMGVGAIALGLAGYGFSNEAPEFGGGMAALALVGHAVGIPIFAVGFKKKPVRTGELVIPTIAPTVEIGPTGGSLTWQF